MLQRCIASAIPYLYCSPTLFILVPTNRCNMHCVYCHAESKNTSDKRLDMSEEIAYKTVNFFFSIPQRYNRFHIEFQGGEPLLRYDLIQKTMDYTIELASKMGMDEVSFTIVSNLTLMTDKIAKDIKARGNINICSSLDGPKAIHDKQRKYSNQKGSYDLVTYWIRRLRDQYKISVGLLPTLTKNTMGFERELVDEYVQWGIRRIKLRFVNYTGRAYQESFRNIGLSPEEYIDIWKRSLNYILEKNKKGDCVIEEQTAVLLQNILTLTGDYMCLRKPCGCGISQLTVGPDGTINGCDGGRSLEMLRLGNILLDTYDNIITSQTTRSLRTINSETLPKCQSCPFGPYCGYCIARGINQHGSPIPKVPLDFECLIYSKMIPYVFNELLIRENAMIFNRWISSL